MKINKRMASIILLIVLLIGSLLAGIALTSRPDSAVAAPASQTAEDCMDDDDDDMDDDNDDLDDFEDEDECDDDHDDDDDVDEEYEAEDEDDDEVVPADAGITAEEAQAIVEAEYPDAATLEVEFERENGKDMFEVELDNGLEVMVDAGNGEILGAEKDD